MSPFVAIAFAREGANVAIVFFSSESGNRSLT